MILRIFFFNFLLKSLCDSGFPYGLIARYGIHDLLSASPEKILPLVPQLVIPIKNALNTRNPEIILATLRIIQHMCNCGNMLTIILIK